MAIARRSSNFEIMLHHKITKTVVLLSLIALSSASRCSADVREQTQLFLNTFCVSCHGKERPKAGLRLEQIDMQRWEDASLLEDKDQFSRAFVENMLSYAMARQLTFRDRENLNLLYEQSADKDFRLRDILLAIVSSDCFTRR